jgi:hypothetical protein
VLEERTEVKAEKPTFAASQNTEKLIFKSQFFSVF